MIWVDTYRPRGKLQPSLFQIRTILADTIQKKIVGEVIKSQRSQGLRAPYYIPFQMHTRE